jgi:hypothetical protein
VVVEAAQVAVEAAVEAVRAEVAVVVVGAEVAVVVAAGAGDNRPGITQPLLNGGKSHGAAHQQDRKRFVV